MDTKKHIILYVLKPCNEPCCTYARRAQQEYRAAEYAFDGCMSVYVLHDIDVTLMSCSPGTLARHHHRHHLRHAFLMLGKALPSQLAQIFCWQTLLWSSISITSTERVERRVAMKRSQKW